MPRGHTHGISFFVQIQTQIHKRTNTSQRRREATLLALSLSYLVVILVTFLWFTFLFIFSLFRCRFKHKYANARTRVSDDEKPTEREALTNVRRAVSSRMPLPIIFFSEALDTVTRVRQRRKTSLAHVCMMTALTRSTGTALHRQTIFPSRLRTLKVWGTFPT